MGKNSKYIVTKSNIKNSLDLYEYLKDLFKDTSLLESLGDIREDSRYNIIGVLASKQLVGDYNNCYKFDYISGEKVKVDFLEEIDKWIEFLYIGKKCKPQQLGLIGYIGYETKFLIEKLACKLVKDHSVPDICLTYYKLVYVFDRLENKAYWVFDKTLDKKFTKIIESNFRNTKKYIRNKFSVSSEIEQDFSYEKYKNSIENTIKSIKNGDIFQANITMRFSGNYQGDSFILYKYLRKKTPNRYFAYLDFKYPILSTSPELFVEIKGKKVVSKPIKGTIKCKIDGIDQSTVLKSSEKNMSENIMITDLIRNDIGRICKHKSVKVEKLCALMKFNSIYHLESIVSGILKENIRFSDFLKATFPGGSITGAPKIKSMDIIEENEFYKRGPYCGSIGFFGRDGWISTSIAIRIIYFSKHKYYLHAGGGIVYDSKTDEEYAELALKASSLIEGLNQFRLF